jgi:hypothetical protein
MGTTYYQTLLLSMLVVKQTLVPLSTEEIIQLVEHNQSTLMFAHQSDSSEKIFRSNSSGKLARFGKAMDKYPPVYKDNLPAYLRRTRKTRGLR